MQFSLYGSVFHRATNIPQMSGVLVIHLFQFSLVFQIILQILILKQNKETTPYLNSTINVLHCVLSFYSYLLFLYFSFLLICSLANFKCPVCIPKSRDWFFLSSNIANEDSVSSRANFRLPKLTSSLKICQRNLC